MIRADHILRQVDTDVWWLINEQVCNPIADRLSDQVYIVPYILAERRVRVPTGRLPRQIWQAIDFQAWEDCGNDPG